MPVEPMIEQPTSPLAVESPPPSAGADDIDIAEHDRRAGRQAGLGGGGLAQSAGARALPSTIGGSRRSAVGARRARRGCSGAYWRVAVVAEGEVRLPTDRWRASPVSGNRASPCNGTRVARARQHLGPVALAARRAARSAGRHSRRCRCARNARHRLGDATNSSAIAAARESSHSQAGATGSPAASISQVPSPWPVTAMATTRWRGPGPSRRARATSRRYRSRCAPCPARRRRGERRRSCSAWRPRRSARRSS